MSRAAQRPAPADDPGAAEFEENGPAAAPLFDNDLPPDRPNRPVAPPVGRWA